MSIYQHYRKHEHPFVDQALSWKQQVESKFIVYVTDFLDPREQQILQMIIGEKNDEIQVLFFGGTEFTERKRAVISPFYEEISNNYYQLTLLGATYPGKFISLSHRDILGTLMSLGIERKVIGDIFVEDDQFHFFTTEEIAPFIQMNMTRINQASITIKEKPFNTSLKSNDVWESSTHIVTSLRLDLLIKEIYRISRKQATQLIKANKVKVNFTDVDDPSVQVMKQDLLSVRGLGRSKIAEIKGTTRKNKTVLTVKRLKTR